MYRFFVSILLFSLILPPSLGAVVISNPHRNYSYTNPYYGRRYYPNRYYARNNPYYSSPIHSRKTSLLKDVKNYFFGQPTGITPPIDNGNFYNYYPQGYGNSSYNQYSSPFWGNGIRMNNYGTTSGVGITMLD